MNYFSPSQHAHAPDGNEQRKPAVFGRMHTMRESIRLGARRAAAWILIATMLPLAGCSKKFDSPQEALRGILSFALSVDTKGCADPLDAYRKVRDEVNKRDFRFLQTSILGTVDGMPDMTAEYVPVKIPYCPDFISYGAEDAAPVERVIPIDNAGDANIIQTWKDPRLLVWAQAASLMLDGKGSEINPATVVRAASALIADTAGVRDSYSEADVRARAANPSYSINVTDAALIATAAISSTGQAIAMPAVNAAWYSGDSTDAASRTPFVLAVIPSSAQGRSQEIPVTIMDPFTAQTWPSVVSFLSWSAQEAMQILPWPDSSGYMESSMLLLPPSSFISDSTVQCFRMNEDSAGVSRFGGERFFLERTDSSFFYLTATNSYDYGLLLNQYTVAQFPVARTNIHELKKKQDEDGKRREEQRRKQESEEVPLGTRERA